jgi:hypothetical protein
MIKPALLNLKQAMEYLNIRSYQTLYKLIDNGLEVTMIGDKRFISVESADKYIKDHTLKPKKG